MRSPAPGRAARAGGLDDDAVRDELLGETRILDEAFLQEHDRESADERHLVGLADRVPRGAGLALPHEALDRLGREQAGVREAALVKELPDIGGRVGADERADDGRAVGLLLPSGDLVRQPVADRLPQEVLLREPAEAELVGSAAANSATR